MANRKKILVAGASGLVGGAALRKFAGRDDRDVVGVSRRPPLAPPGRASHVAVDLQDRDHCARTFGAMTDVTHLVFAALSEKDDDLVAGWSDSAQIAINDALLRNVIDPLTEASPALEHISLVHGGKAYGVHLGLPLAMPLREDASRHPGENFYYRQHDYLLEKQTGQPWSWTILRPGGIVGAAVGANMNTFFVLAVYAALKKEAGEPLPLPSGKSAILNLTDADLIADALEWAMDAPEARNEIFNVNNGDLFRQHDAFAVLAECFGMETEAPRAIDLKSEVAVLKGLWPGMVERHGLNAPDDLGDVLGNSIQIAGGWAADIGTADSLQWGVECTIKIRKAGFPSCVSTPEMLARYAQIYRELRLIP